MRPIASTGHRFQFEKRGQQFICMHNETLSVAAMCVCNPDRLPFAIDCRDPAQTPTGIVEIVSNYFPTLHCARAVGQVNAVSALISFSAAIDPEFIEGL
jgi:hypothetical protein